MPDTVLKDTDWLLISGNNLGSLNKAPGYLKNIITLLDLSSSHITEINEIVMEFITTNVKHLDVRRNNLKTLPQTHYAHFTNDDDSQDLSLMKYDAFISYR